MESKDWWKSRTIWVQVVAGAATLASLVGFHFLDDPETQNSIVAIATFAVTIWLRFKTDLSVK